jgi:2-keto-3-deoxy-L-rhamnonate aldolase RhmA
MTRLEELIRNTKAAPLLGVACYRPDAAFVEIAGRLGFHIVWIEMEHAHISFGEAADLCRAAAGVGLATMIRIPDARRENVLRAAECGPDIIDLPMANSPEILEEFVRHARYAPEGNRGFFGASRAVGYGLSGDIVAEQRRINESLCLMGQIETREAVEEAEALCAVKGVNAFLLGLGDLSSSLGVVGATGHPLVREAAEKVIGIVKGSGKIAVVAGAPADAATWAQKGADVLFCASDIMCLRTGAQSVLDQARG